MPSAVVQRDTTVTMTLNEEEALFVLGALGMTTGPMAAESTVYNELFGALQGAGYGTDFLLEQYVEVIP